MATSGQGRSRLRRSLLPLAFLTLVLFAASQRHRVVAFLAFHPVRGGIEPSRLRALDAERVTLVASDGVQLVCYRIGPNASSRAVLYLHGNAEHAAHAIGVARHFAGPDVVVLVQEYRGYGESGGAPTEAGAALDVRAGFDFLVDELGVAPARIVLVGRSLGSAFAVQLATEVAAAGLILVSPLESGRAMSARMGLGLVAPLFGRPFDSIGRMADVEEPLLVVHGALDDIVPIEQGRALFAAARTPVEFIAVEGADHIDVLDRSELRARLIAFVDSVAPSDVRGQPSVGTSR